MSQLDSECLKVNKNWQPIGIITVRKAFSDAAAEAVTLLKFHDGYPTPYRLEDWLRLPVEDQDEYIGVGGRLHDIRKISVPRVCITVNFDRIIAKEQKCTPDNLLRRYGHRDAVTGKKLKRINFSREHKIPKSKGGRDGWGNEVPMDRKLNSRRGNRPYAKIGLRPPKVLPAPRPLLPINTLVNKNGFIEWDAFQIPRK